MHLSTVSAVFIGFYVSSVALQRTPITVSPRSNPVIGAAAKLAEVVGRSTASKIPQIDHDNFLVPM